MPTLASESADDALVVDLLTEPDDMRGLRCGVGGQVVQRVVPGGQQSARGGVEEAFGVLVPDGEVAAGLSAVDGCLVCWPPHLVVGRGGDLADEITRHGPSDGHVQVRGEAFLWLDHGEVLRLVSGAPAQVLHEPVNALGEVQRVERGAAVVVRRRVDRGAVGATGP